MPYLVQVDGQQVTVDDAQVVELLQKGLASDKRFQEAASIKAAAEKLQSDLQALGTTEEINAGVGVLRRLQADLGGEIARLAEGMLTPDRDPDGTFRTRIAGLVGSGLPSNDVTPGGPATTGVAGLDYDVTGDPVYQQLSGQLGELTAMIKRLEEVTTEKVGVVEGSLNQYAQIIGQLSSRTVAEDLRGKFPDIDPQEIMSYATQNGINNFDVAAHAILGQRALTASTQPTQNDDFLGLVNEYRNDRGSRVLRDGSSTSSPAFNQQETTTDSSTPTGVDLRSTEARYARVMEQMAQAGGAVEGAGGFSSPA